MAWGSAMRPPPCPPPTGCATGWPGHLALAGTACYTPPLFEVRALFSKTPAPPSPCTRLPGAAAASGHEGEVMANDVSTLPAQKRDQSGKGPSHRLRAKGLIPAVCYGPYDKPLHVAIDPDAIKKAIATPHKFNTVITLQVEGGETRTVLFKDFERTRWTARCCTPTSSKCAWTRTSP